jgi:uracil-DNA glycosylase family 4
MEDRAARLASLRTRAEHAGAEVFGEGDPAARLMLVGEAPGSAEAEAHRPFVGPAGLVLNRLLDRLSIPRSALWITNVVKIRPVAEGLRTKVNRPPTATEIATFQAILDEEISLIRPRVIVCLGSVAASTLIHPSFRVVSERGEWHPGPFGARVMATYHPAYLLRRRGPGYESARDEMLADLSRAWAEALGE